MISFDVNNGGILNLEQKQHDGAVTVRGNGYNFEISGEDMIALISYYIFVKDEDIQCDFINLNGKNSR